MMTSGGVGLGAAVFLSIAAWIGIEVGDVVRFLSPYAEVRLAAVGDGHGPWRCGVDRLHHPTRQLSLNKTRQRSLKAADLDVGN